MVGGRLLLLLLPHPRVLSHRCEAVSLVLTFCFLRRVALQVTRK